MGQTYRDGFIDVRCQTIIAGFKVRQEIVQTISQFPVGFETGEVDFNPFLEDINNSNFARQI